MAKQQSQQHRLSQVSAVAVDRHRSLHHGRLPGRFRRRLLPQHAPHAVLSICHVLYHCCPHRVHYLCLCGDGQRVGPACDGPGLLGVSFGGLFRLAEGPGN